MLLLPLALLPFLFTSTAQLPSPTLPTQMQLEYQKRDVAMFIHFSMCTFAPGGGCEQDTNCTANRPSLFNPEHVNTTQWLETAKAMGAKEVCLTAHHSGGFALFQTNHTSYGIKESPYKGGKGDIVKEFTDSCKAFGISPCLYFINAWDCWEAARPDATNATYLNAQLGMLSDLMNREKYGKINRFWFDEFGFSSHPGQSPAGLFPAAWKQIVKHVRMASPGTMMLPGPDGCKNRGEGGGGEYPVLNYVPIVPGVNRSCQNASVDGKIYAPFESDMSIENPGDAWFWHKGHVFDNATNLWSKYLATSGRGSTFILNVPPNTSGLIPQGYVASVAALGDAITATFGTTASNATASNAAGCDGSAVLATVPTLGHNFDAVLLLEDLRKGQNILGFKLEVQDKSTKKWRTAALDQTSCAGQTVGSRCVAILNDAAADGDASAVVAVRLKCTAIVHKTDATVSLASMSLHKLQPPKAL